MVQLVAHDLAKVELAGSSPVYRSELGLRFISRSFFFCVTILTSISMEEAKKIFATPGDYIILDVRTAGEYANGRGYQCCK